MSDNNPWDDAAFKTRVKAAAAKKGITLRDALLAAGVSRGHLDKTGEGRMTSTILRLAAALDVSPAYLFGISEQMQASAKRGKPIIDRDKRIALYTKIIAAQLATLVYMSSDNSNEESKDLMEFVLRVIDQVSNVERGGKTPAM